MSSNAILSCSFRICFFFLLMCFHFSLSFHDVYVLYHYISIANNAINVKCSCSELCVSTSPKTKHCTIQWKCCFMFVEEESSFVLMFHNFQATESIKSLRHLFPTHCYTFMSIVSSVVVDCGLLECERVVLCFWMVKLCLLHSHHVWNIWCVNYSHKQWDYRAINGIVYTIILFQWVN